MMGKHQRQALELLRTLGPMTSAEMDRELGICERQRCRVLASLSKATRRRPRLVHIARWVYDSEGARRYPRPVYAFGDAPDARKPKSNGAARVREYRQRQRALQTTNFVFNLGRLAA